jgi:hypothetical protein
MFKYEVSKDLTPAKIKTQAKADLIALFTEFLSEKFGEDAVAMVQSGAATSPKRELGFIFGTVMMNGQEVPLVATINPTTKEFYDHKSDKGKEYKTFDFHAAAATYDKYLADKAQKAADKEKENEDKS